MSNSSPRGSGTLGTMRRLCALAFALLPLPLAALEPQDPPADPRDPFRKVEGWLLECNLHCDDQVDWTAAGGSYRYHKERKETLVASLELKRRGEPFYWYGKGEARMTHGYLARTEYSGGEWHWSRTEAGPGVVKVWADLTMHGAGAEKGKIFTFVISPERDDPGLSGTLSGEHYHVNNQYKWVLDTKSSETKTHDFTSSWAFYARHRLPEKGLDLSGSAPFPVEQWFTDHPKNDRLEHHISYPHQGTVRWRLVPLGTPLLDVVIDPPEGYKEWLPVAGESEKKAGSMIAVTARLVARDGTPPKRKARKFIFEIVNGSSEPGVCINAPIKDAQTTPDLAFEPDISRLVVSSPLSLRGETAPGEHVSATAVVSCFDYGAYGDLKVTAEMEDGERIEGYVRDDSSRTLLPLPYREGGSRAAWAWLQQVGALGRGDTDDSESEPVGDGFKGDGLTLYEEYRGFKDRNGHRRGDPKTKELFVANRLGRDADSGFTLFEKASGMVVRVLGEETHPDREVNFNRSANSPLRCPQHLVLLEGPKLGLDKDTGFKGGRTVIDLGRRKKVTPVSVSRIMIPTTKPENVPVLGADSKAAEANYTDISIAHELLHAVGVLHHGDGDSLNGVQWTRRDGPRRITEGDKPIEVFIEGTTQGALKPEDEKFDQPLDIVLAVQNGAFSGDQGCLMRYAWADAYVFPGNRSTKRFYIRYETPEAWGLGLCSSPDGTGINAPGRTPQPRYGKATRGRCAQQLRVSDAE